MSRGHRALARGLAALMIALPAFVLAGAGLLGQPASAQTCQSSVGPGIPPPASPRTGQPGFHAAWYGQSGYMRLCPGAQATAIVAYYNSGHLGWVRGRMGEAAYLGTWYPVPGQDRASPLGGDGQLGSPNTGWPRYNRMATQPAPYVGPGQVAWFQFAVQGPATPGYYWLYLRPLIEGATWMEDYGVYWLVTVPNADGSDPGSVPPPTRTPAPTAPPPASAVLVGAGNIASCSSSGDEATAALLDGIPGTVFTLGDNVYPDGSAADFANCYDPSWGRHRARTRPAAGNHEYDLGNASGYFGYFGAAAGDPARGYYSYQLGAWHIVVLNSNCDVVGGCGPGSAQEQWLRADLAAHPASCTLAMWHKPRFSSGAAQPGDATYAAFWQALYDYNADVALVAHSHHYERFAPQTAGGDLDYARGIREFVVGTGGVSHFMLGATAPNSEIRNDTTFGVLKLTLSASSYAWQFVPIAGQTFSDAGSAACH